MNAILVGDYVRFTGPGGGVGVTHRVVFSSPEEVITASWSHGYIGEPADFRKHFELLARGNL